MSEIIDEKKLSNIEGGLSVSGTLINAFTSGIKIVLEVGRSFGTSLRRIISGNLCSI
ncbi:MAG: bacteriocin [Bacilli bacterium]|nr:bacteriocin [Bacilli bacterium]